MAPPKRKRIPTRNTTNKRPKYTQPDSSSSSSTDSSSSSDSEETENNSQEEWEALRILAQTGRGFGARYLIEWAGIDPATGKQWEPSWVRATSASEGLRTAWRRDQTSQAKAKRGAVAAAKSSAQQRGAPEVLPTQATQTQGATPRYIAESTEASSPESEEETLVESRGEIGSAPDLATGNVGASVPDAVDLSGNSFIRVESELHAEIPESQPLPTKSSTEDTDLESSQLFASQPAFCASGIVPDTQSSRGDVSYIPVTQEDLESSVYSGSSDDSVESADHIIGHLGLSAKQPPTPDTRAQSPATSIAETVAETTQEQHSQRRFESQQVQSGIPETLVSSSGNSLEITQDESSDHQADFPPRGLHDTENQQDSSLSVAFVENTTHLEHCSQGTASQELRRPAVISDRHSASVGEEYHSPTRSTYPTVGLEGSEIEHLAVKATPQISQLASTAQAALTPKESPHCTQQSRTQPSIEDVTQVSLTERTVLEENAQFPFHSQHPTFFDPRSATKPSPRALTEPPRLSDSQEIQVARLSKGLGNNVREQGAIFNDSEESTTIDEISQPHEQAASHTSIQSNCTSYIPQDQQSEEHLDNAGIRHSDTIVSQASVVNSHLTRSSDKSSASRGHNAQLVLSSVCLGTQEELTGSVLPITKAESREAVLSDHVSPLSRHDSSQESPERPLHSAEYSPSPIPRPPSHSPRTLESNVPPRPITPILTTPSSRMADNIMESSADAVDRRLKELAAAHAANNPYVPRRRTRVPQAPQGPGMASGPPAINVSAEGTRSPSTVPDRSPAPPVQTSLRNVAFANAKDKAMASLLENPLAATSMNTDAGPTKEKAELVAAVAAGVAPIVPGASTDLPADDKNEEIDDDDPNIDYDEEEDDGSLYHDDLHLEKEEYIIPLFISGRQRDTYTAYLEQKTDLLNTVLDSVLLVANPAPEKLDEVEQVLAYLKNVEDHPDLTYAEAESATGFDIRSAADVQHGARFGIDNSVKFKFLEELFNQLRKQSMHIVLLLDEDNTALMNILRTFLAAGAHNYDMPTKGYQSNASNDTLRITVLPRTTSVVIQRADLAICINGVQSATQVRQRDWAMASAKLLPVLHLVIPQTIGHIERFMLPNSPRRTRIETILTALGQIEARNEIGNQIDIDTPGAVEAAKLVASWLTPHDDQDNTEWPLPSIGSAQNFMEYDATQQSIRSAASSPAPERTKRPLDTEDFDPAKRMRYTPPAHVIPNSSALPEPETTRVSNSMPGSAATENARLAISLDRLKSELLQVQRERRDEQIMWDKQQTEHENRQQQYRKLFNEKEELDRAHESMTRNRDKLRSQFDAQAAELRTLRDELDAQRNLALASSNEKDIEITRLRKEVEAANMERNKALNSVQSNEKTLEYTKEQYRDASNAAGRLQLEVTILEEERTKLTHQASGEVAKLKQLHLDRSMKNAITQNNILKHEISTLKATLKQQQEELTRAKNNSGRAAYGTRAQSTTPQPKTRSRAASPERGVRAPRGGGRISNLVAEER